MDSDCLRSIEAIERYGKLGYVVSVAYGPCGDRGILYSVDVLNVAEGEVFPRAFAVSSFADIAKVLDNEIPKMGQQ